MCKTIFAFAVDNDLLPACRNAELGEAFALVRSEMALARRIAALTHRLSDANLAAMPEFHLRVAVLRHLQCATVSSSHLRTSS